MQVGSYLRLSGVHLKSPLEDAGSIMQGAYAGYLAVSILNRTTTRTPLRLGTRGFQLRLRAHPLHTDTRTHTYIIKHINIYSI